MTLRFRFLLFSLLIPVCVATLVDRSKRQELTAHGPPGPPPDPESKEDSKEGEEEGHVGGRGPPAPPPALIEWMKLPNGRTLYDGTFDHYEPKQGKFLCSLESVIFLNENHVPATFINGAVEIQVGPLPDNTTKHEEGTSEQTNQTLVEELIKDEYRPAQLLWECEIKEQCHEVGCAPLSVNTERKSVSRDNLPAWLNIDKRQYYDQTNVVVESRSGEIMCSMETGEFLTHNNVTKLSEIDFNGIEEEPRRIFTLGAFNLSDFEALNRTLAEQIHAATPRPAELAWWCVGDAESCCGAGCCRNSASGPAFNAILLIALGLWVVLTE